jgi:hypothetical protein
MRFYTQQHKYYCGIWNLFGGNLFGGTYFLNLFLRPKPLRLRRPSGPGEGRVYLLAPRRATPF